MNGSGIKANLKAFKKKTSIIPIRSQYRWNSTPARHPLCYRHHYKICVKNNYLSHAYGKESFGTWGARLCMAPGVTELLIHRPYTCYPREVGVTPLNPHS